MPVGVGLLALLLASHRPPAMPGEGACRTYFRRAIADRSFGEVPESCWRVGPIILRMREEDVERRLGPPVAVTEVGADGTTPGRRHVAALYAFSGAPGPLVSAGRARLRLAELRYENGRLAAIDTNPGVRTSSTPCARAPIRQRPSDEVGLGIAAGPLLSFAGLSVGASVNSLEGRFGRKPWTNASQDWYTYLPVPLSFDADPGRGVVTGFALAIDTQELTTSAGPTLHLLRDPQTCLLTSIRFGFRNP